ncbi:hypothetical protein Hdeb2414_s0242g00845351 [Helianthus debilis subsp. tardiflorus]
MVPSSFDLNIFSLSVRHDCFFFRLKFPFYLQLLLSLLNVDVQRLSLVCDWSLFRLYVRRRFVI